MMLHWLSHLLGWNEGTVETWWTKTDPPKLMVGFRCSCGKLLNISPCYHGKHKDPLA